MRSQAMQQKGTKARAWAHRLEAGVHLGLLRSGLGERNNPQQGQLVPREGTRGWGIA